MPEKHLSSQFDSDLNRVSTRLMAMGGLVELQIAQSAVALAHVNLGALAPAVAGAVEQVFDLEQRVNAMEMEIDRELSSIIGRRQPTARDLRLLMAISKATANLERAGDEATKIARMVLSIAKSEAGKLLPSSELRLASDLAIALLHKALDSFARLDVASAVAILKEDDAIDGEFEAFVRRLVVHMMAEPQSVSVSLDLLFLAKAIERIGDHAKNIAELIIYIVSGADVRHASMDAIESASKIR